MTVLCLLILYYSYFNLYQITLHYRFFMSGHVYFILNSEFGVFLSFKSWKDEEVISCKLTQRPGGESDGWREVAGASGRHGLDPEQVDCVVGQLVQGDLCGLHVSPAAPPPPTLATLVVTPALRLLQHTNCTYYTQ